MRSSAFPGYGRPYPPPGAASRRTPRHHRSHRLNFRGFFRYLTFAVLLSLTVALAGGAVWAARALSGVDRDLSAILTYNPGETTFIYASDGSLLARIAKENRVYVPLDRMPPALRDGTVATEDRRFWEHSGVDLRGLARAFWRDVNQGRAAEGGSTLTMQLVRNIRLTPEKTLERKVREAALALQLERIYEKPRLLEMYLNQVFYGSGAYGVGAAARTYFGKPVDKLTPAQSALLATIPRRPTEHNPHRDPDGSLARRNRLLKEMASQGYLTPEQLAKALKEPLGVRPRPHRSVKAPYFVDAVVDRLTDLYGEEKVYQGGMRVYTTLNPRLQADAEDALRRGVNRLRGRNVTQGALVSLDPFTQEVKAMVGGVDYRKSAFNRTLAKRQPGSVFKPFVYASAFDMGLSPLDRVTDAPIRFARWDGWRPKNHGGGYAGRTTLRNAFAQSLNVPAVKLALSAGIPQVSDMARACGIRSPLRNLPSLALGTSEVTLLEMTSSYGTFATMGLWTDPKLIRRVEDRKGIVLDRFDSFPASVLDTTTAQKVDYVMRAAVEGGTAKAAASVPHARGKTGTTQRDKDAWFIGYTPELVTGVWLGNDRPSRMHGIWGGTGCAPIWTSYMSRALKQYPRRPPMPTWTPPKHPKPDPVDPSTAEDPLMQASQTGEGPAQGGEGDLGWQQAVSAEAWVMGNSRPVSSSPSEGYGNAEYGVSSRPSGRKLRLCTDTGEKAGPHCLNTFATTVEPDMEIRNCSYHRPHADAPPAPREATDPLAYEREAWGMSAPQG